MNARSHACNAVGWQQNSSLLRQAGMTSRGVRSAGDQLVLRSMAGKGASPAEVVLPFRFKPRRWYHVVAAHAAGGTLSASLSVLFVDGAVVSVAEKLKYPKVGWVHGHTPGCMHSPAIPDDCSWYTFQR